MIIFYNLAPVAQLDRALGYGPGGSGFDSYQAHQIMKISLQSSVVYFFTIVLIVLILLTIFL